MKTLKLFIVVAVVFLVNSCSKSSGNNSSNPPAPVITVPVLGTTNTINTITATSAASGGIVTSEGGGTVIAKGICWSTSANPTVANFKTTDGAGQGTFTSNLTGLTASTAYYVRAYATNSAGTSYGNEINFSTSADIGTNFQGGKLAYILSPADAGFDPAVQHGIIVATTDQANVISWDNGTRHSTGATGTAIGTGNDNTNKIVATEGAGTYPAKVCYDLVLNGYSDWYLPSKDELNILYLNQSKLGTFFPYMYWSSSESTSSYFDAWEIRFDGANIPTLANKNYAFIVRAVRSY